MRADRGGRGWAKEVLPNPDLLPEVCKVTTPAAPLSLSAAWPLVKRIGRPLSGAVPHNTQKTRNLTSRARGFQTRVPRDRWWVSGRVPEARGACSRRTYLLGKTHPPSTRIQVA